MHEQRINAGNRVMMSFRMFDVETSDHCNLDYVEVHEEGAEGRLLGHFCGSDIPANITASHRLWVKFRSDAMGTAAGFIADYALSEFLDLEC